MFDSVPVQTHISACTRSVNLRPEVHLRNIVIAYSELNRYTALICLLEANSCVRRGVVHYAANLGERRITRRCASMLETR